MTKFFSPSTGGFYDPALHGPRQISIADPDWVRPLVRVADPDWERPLVDVADPEWVRPMIEVPDPSASPPLIEALDPDWRCPLIEIDDPLWVRPVRHEPDPEFEAPFPGVEAPLIEVVDEEAVHTKVMAPDPHAVCPIVLVADPEWVRPMIEVENDEAVAPLISIPDEAAEHPQISIPDPSAEPPMVEVANPACRLPEDAVEVGEADYDALYQAQAEGLRITAGENGRPIASAPPPPALSELVKARRSRRDSLLQASDWTQLPDVLAGMQPAAAAAWVVYRQTLRDLDFTAEPFEFPASPE